MGKSQFPKTTSRGGKGNSHSTAPPPSSCDVRKNERKKDSQLTVPSSVRTLFQAFCRDRYRDQEKKKRERKKKIMWTGSWLKELAGASKHEEEEEERGRGAFSEDSRKSATTQAQGGDSHPLNLSAGFARRTEAKPCSSRREQRDRHSGGFNSGRLLHEPVTPEIFEKRRTKMMMTRGGEAPRKEESPFGSNDLERSLLPSELVLPLAERAQAPEGVKTPTKKRNVLLERRPPPNIKRQHKISKAAVSHKPVRTSAALSACRNLLPELICRKYTLSKENLSVQDKAIEAFLAGLES